MTLFEERSYLRVDQNSGTHELLNTMEHAVIDPERSHYGIRALIGYEPGP